MNLVGPPEAVLYRLLFKTANSLGVAASKREAGGRDASPLRQFYARHAAMNPGENDIVFQVAAEAAAAEAADVAVERNLIAQYRAARQAYALSAGPEPASPLPQLQQLQADRDAVALRARGQLHNLLGDDGFDRLELYVHRTFGRAAHETLPPPLASPAATGGTGGIQ